MEWEDISECVDWMVPFVSVVKSVSPVKLKTFKKIAMEDRHNIQTHTNYLALLVCFFVYLFVLEIGYSFKILSLFFRSCYLGKS